MATIQQTTIFPESVTSTTDEVHENETVIITQKDLGKFCEWRPWNLKIIAATETPPARTTINSKIDDETTPSHLQNTTTSSSNLTTTASKSEKLVWFEIDFKSALEYNGVKIKTFFIEIS